MEYKTYIFPNTPKIVEFVQRKKISGVNYNLNSEYAIIELSEVTGAFDDAAVKIKVLSSDELEITQIYGDVVVSEKSLKDCLEIIFGYDKIKGGDESFLNFQFLAPENPNKVKYIFASIPHVYLENVDSLIDADDDDIPTIERTPFVPSANVAPPVVDERAYAFIDAQVAELERIRLENLERTKKEIENITARISTSISNKAMIEQDINQSNKKLEQLNRALLDFNNSEVVSNGYGFYLSSGVQEASSLDVEQVSDVLKFFGSRLDKETIGKLNKALTCMKYTLILCDLVDDKLIFSTDAKSLSLLKIIHVLGFKHTQFGYTYTSEGKEGDETYKSLVMKLIASGFTQRDDLTYRIGGVNVSNLVNYLTGEETLTVEDCQPCVDRVVHTFENGAELKITAIESVPDPEFYVSIGDEVINIPIESIVLPSTLTKLTTETANVLSSSGEKDENDMYNHDLGNGMNIKHNGGIMIADGGDSGFSFDDVKKLMEKASGRTDLFPETDED
jgi:hypothetical protein